jgi:hypothetical protein
MKKETLVNLFLVILFLYSCGKASPVPDEITNQVDTQSISNTDLTGFSLGQVDPTDWTFDNNWMATETVLFETPTATQLASTADTGTVSIFVAYPNPLTTVFNWGFKTTKPAFIQIIITDNFLTVKKRISFVTQVGTNNLSIQMPESEFVNNKNYRLYYAFYCANRGLYFKGHGDIAVRR